MKKQYIYQVIPLFMMLFLFSMLNGQNPYQQDLVVPLSNPGQIGKLTTNQHNGGIRIESHKGKDVLVTIISHASEDTNKRPKEVNGLKRIPNTAMNFEITEENNEVHIQGSHRGKIDFIVKVPSNFNLSIQTHHNGNIFVSGVSGEIEVDGHHGGIELENVGGSVIADTHHGTIKVALNTVKNNAPMAFSTYHGDVDITFPSSVNMTSKIKTSKGDIYTDFEMKTKVQMFDREKDDRDGKGVKIGGWLYADIGDGGPEFMFTTYHGDIFIKKG